jgi:ribonuclease E
MAKKMLIDATHAEETRVVVVEGNKVEEFDFESLNKKQLAGSIYLAKVTRVEPSLQAAFVDYGGNRHGFLAFSEIHPDYYQIPVEDRKLLIEEERAYAKKLQEDADQREQALENKLISNVAQTDENNLLIESKENLHRADEEPNSEGQDASNEVTQQTDGTNDSKDEQSEKPTIKPRRRRYKIQEVIKVRQILLIQVVKEERGNKGAALTTYLSIAGRYCVLMPNTARGGGISRKITNANDRKRLKVIANELDIPEGTGLIVRTAGANRTKLEIKRDFEYLLRQWEEVRDLTLKSIAPCQIYEEGSLIKRSIRDLYTRDVDEIFVEGEVGYQSAKEFMKMLMPSHAKKIRQYDDPMPLFSRYQVESFLSGMFNPTVQLKSGGYIVIGITEALVAIDVNSGRATKEGSIEDTALKTNLEASEELVRQLRLRDLAGLIVIDFIDMDERRNNNAVEKRLKDKLKDDRARIQVGKISNFGLLEMSRQRLRPGMLEATTAPCAHCHGTGLIRSDDNLALMILREIEEEAVRGKNKELLISTSFDVANYLINHKRDHILEIEKRNGISIRIEAQPNITNPNYIIEKFKEATRQILKPDKHLISVDTSIIEISETPLETSEDVISSEGVLEENNQVKKKRKRRKRSGKSKNNNIHEEKIINNEDCTKLEEIAPKPEDSGAKEDNTILSGEEKVKSKRKSNRKAPIRKTLSSKMAEVPKIENNPEDVLVKKKIGRPRKTKADAPEKKSNATSQLEPEEKVKTIKKKGKAVDAKDTKPNKATEKKKNAAKTPRSGWWSRNK